MKFNYSGNTAAITLFSEMETKHRLSLEYQKSTVGMQTKPTHSIVKLLLSFGSSTASSTAKLAVPDLKHQEQEEDNNFTSLKRTKKTKLLS